MGLSVCLSTVIEGELLQDRAFYKFLNPSELSSALDTKEVFKA